MLLDHLYSFLRIQELKYFYPLGRLSMPLFAFALSYGLAIQKSKYFNLPTIKRILIFGLISSVPYIALGNVMSGWWPLNIMFTFLISAIIISILSSTIKQRYLITLIVFVIGGAFVEYAWAGIALTVSFWWFVKRADWMSLSLIILSMIMLNNFNHNLWATLALPIIYLASKINFAIPRIKHFFYYVYPIQLSVIWIVRSIYT
jgi:hypothetical protein